MNEADTCRKLVVPALQAAGWDTEPHRISEQVTFTDGRIVVVGKRADFILRNQPDMPLQFEEFAPCLAWWEKREESDRAWKVPAGELLTNGCNLDRKNPRAKEDITHLPPEKLVAGILEKEQKIIEIVGRIKVALERKES